MSECRAGKCLTVAFCDHHRFCIARMAVPRVRVKAWRVANEDHAPWSIVLQRAAPALPWPPCDDPWWGRFLRGALTP